MVAILQLVACTNFMGGFKPPVSRNFWTLPDFKSKNLQLNDYIDLKEKDMRACGIDPFVGDTDNTAKALCMEKKAGYTPQVLLVKDHYIEMSLSASNGKMSINKLTENK